MGQKALEPRLTISLTILSQCLTDRCGELALWFQGGRLRGVASNHSEASVRGCQASGGCGLEIGLGEAVISLHVSQSEDR